MKHIQLNNINTEISAYLENNAANHFFRRRIVLVKNEEHWQMVSASIVAVKTQIQSSPRKTLYPNVTLYEDCIDLRGLLDFYQKIIKGELSLYGMSVIVSIKGNVFTAQRLYRDNLYYKGACEVINVQTDRALTQNGYPGPLASLDSPYYPDIDEAEKNWLDLRVYNGSQDGRKGDISLILPESRAGIISVKKAGNVIAVTTSKELNPLRESLKISAWERGEFKSLSPEIKANEHTCLITEETSRIQIALIINYSEIVDLAYIHNFQQAIDSFDEIEDDRSAEIKAIEAALESGEGANVEFKPFININHPKIDDVVKTAASMSNASGGLIILGISDECEVVGLNAAPSIDEDMGLRKEFRLSGVYEEGSVADRVNKYIGDLKKTINDRVINHSPKILYKAVEYGGEFLVVITIQESDNKPAYLNGKADIWLRRGANNIKAKPREYSSILCS